MRSSPTGPATTSTAPRALHRPATLDELREIVAARAARARARLAPLVQRRSPTPPSWSRSTACRPTSPSTARPARSPAAPALTLRRAAAALAAHGAGAAQPRLAAAHLGRRRGRHRDPRLGRRATATSPRRSRRRRARHLRRRARHRARAATPDFDGLVVGLGALGAVTRVTLDVEPAYEVRQRVFEGLALGRAARALRRDHRQRLQRQRLHALGRDGRPGVGQEPRRRRARAGARRALRRRRGDASTATRSSASTRSTARRSSASRARGRTACRTSAWASRPSNGEELQSEYLRAAPTRRRGDRRRVRAPRPTRCARCCRSREIRTIAADGLWMSPQYGRPTRRPALHVDARARGGRARAGRPRGRAGAVRARPHWGKAFRATAADLAPRYERLRRLRAPGASASTRAAPFATTGSSATSSAARGER